MVTSSERASDARTLPSSLSAPVNLQQTRELEMNEHYGMSVLDRGVAAGQLLLQTLTQDSGALTLQLQAADLCSA